jgi:DNA-binding NarL/FixJ family response regulator
MPVLVMSVHPVQAYAVRMIRSGANGYLTKVTALEELIEAIQTVVTGRNYITLAVAEYLAASLQGGPGKGLHAGLSNREFQVFRMLAQGKTLKEIADRCQVSPNTVSTYRARVLEKLKITNNAQLTCYAIEHSLIDYP